jgi:hypothetical protein
VLELTLDGGWKPSEGEVQRFLIQAVGGDFLAKAGEDYAHTFGYGGVTFAFSKLLYFRLAQNFVGRRKFAEQGRILGR